VYAHSDDEILVNLYISGSCALDVGGSSIVIRQQGNYPWQESIHFTIEAAAPALFSLALRVPAWCASAEIMLNDSEVPSAELVDNAGGYLTIRRTWRPGDRVTLRLPAPIRRLYAHPAVAADAGCVALARGPIIYCLEGIDNDPALHLVSLPRDAQFTQAASDELGGIVVVRADAVRDTQSDGNSSLYRDEPVTREPTDITAVPYYAWANRDAGPMRVWIRETVQ
jgi:DUF1680 family protein